MAGEWIKDGCVSRLDAAPLFAEVIDYGLQPGGRPRWQWRVGKIKRHPMCRQAWIGKGWSQTEVGARNFAKHALNSAQGVTPPPPPAYSDKGNT